MTKEQLRMQFIGGIITESEYKAKLEENKSPKSKNSLNENIVSIGAINNPFPKRAKSDYELAFEYFSKGGLNEEESSNSNIENYLLGLFNSIDLGDEYQEGPQTYTFEKIEWGEEDLYGEKAKMFMPAHNYISSRGKLTLTDSSSKTPLSFSTEGENIVVNFNTEDFPGLD